MDNRIVSVDIVDGELIVTYQDGSTESLGPVAELDPEELSAAVLKNAGDIVDLKRAVSALQTSVTALDTAVGASETSIDSLEAEVGAIKNDLSEFPNGNYPQMGAGYANQLVSGLKKEDSTPYNFRAVPYDATLEEVEKIVGGTVVNNQLLPELKNGNNWSPFNYTTTYTWGSNEVTINADANGDIQNNNFRTVVGHKYFIAMMFNNSSDTVTAKVTASSPAGVVYEKLGVQNSYSSGEALYSATTETRLMFQAYNGTKFKNLQIVDITQDFGSTIADYVYNLETATAGAGVAWLKTHFPKQFDSGYQAYDAGTLKSIEGLSGKKTVGFNQWDEVWEAYGSVQIKSKNRIRLFGGVTYYAKTPSVGITLYFKKNKDDVDNIGQITVVNNTFVVPSNANYAVMYTGANYGNVYNHDICINLSDPTKNGTYEPYEAHSYALDSEVVLRGIPKLNSNNQLYYDGDEYLPDGTVNRRYRYITIADATSVTVGTTASGVRYADVKLANRDTDATAALNNTPAITPNYVWHPIGDTGASGMVKTYSVALTVYDSRFTSAVEATRILTEEGFAAVYKLATPTTETADPYTTPQIIAPDGTEEYIYEDGAFELPVGHSSDYPVDVSGQLDDILDTPSANGTYTLKATVTDGAVTYSWVADA